MEVSSLRSPVTWNAPIRACHREGLSPTFRPRCRCCRWVVTSARRVQFPPLEGHLASHRWHGQAAARILLILVPVGPLDALRVGLPERSQRDLQSVPGAPSGPCIAAPAKRLEATVKAPFIAGSRHTGPSRGQFPSRLLYPRHNRCHRRVILLCLSPSWCSPRRQTGRPANNNPKSAPTVL